MAESLKGLWGREFCFAKSGPLIYLSRKILKYFLFVAKMSGLMPSNKLSSWHESYELIFSELCDEAQIRGYLHKIGRAHV